MKVLVFGGSGKMGAAVAFDLVRDQTVEAVGLVGRRREALEQTRAWLGSDKVVLHALDVERKDDVMALMRRYDVGVNTLPDRHTSYMVVDAPCGPVSTSSTCSRSTTGGPTRTSSRASSCLRGCR